MRTIPALLLLPTMLHGQPRKGSSELYNILKTKDSLLFDIGYNQCNIGQFERLVSDTFEFYHDNAGVTRTKAAFIDGIKNGMCKLNYKPKRVLVPGSMEVYPMEHNGQLYGAIENGTHEFYAIEKDGREHLTSTARFTMLWLLEDGTWRLSRALSYDHQLPTDSKQ